ncbi:NUDIX hydrolase [Lichenicoccus sp.]|uniref:NUDIX hydrolase n=1 Tax=Lichenicoccus sp. TaxID=2781899 RepID=UPI003D0DF981
MTEGARVTGEPCWLIRAREVQAIAQTGLAFSRDPYDRERYEALRRIAASMMAAGVDAEPAALLATFQAEQGYATPKIDVRGAVFDDEDRLLLVRETADDGRWTLPGGWADVNQTASECVVREIQEESGYTARALKLALLHDRARQGHQPAGLFSIYKLFFVCALTGGAARGSLETSAVGFFAEHAIPADLSTSRTLPHQIARLFAHHRDPSLPTEFD